MFILGSHGVKMAIATAAASTAAQAQDVDNRCSRDKCGLEMRHISSLRYVFCILFYFDIFFIIIYINYANEGAVGKIFL
jgi:hypothetical protein